MRIDSDVPLALRRRSNMNRAFTLSYPPTTLWNCALIVCSLLSYSSLLCYIEVTPSKHRRLLFYRNVQCSSTRGKRETEWTSWATASLRAAFVIGLQPGCGNYQMHCAPARRHHRCRLYLTETRQLSIPTHTHIVRCLSGQPSVRRSVHTFAYVFERGGQRSRGAKFYQKAIKYS